MPICPSGPVSVLMGVSQHSTVNVHVRLEFFSTKTKLQANVRSAHLNASAVRSSVAIVVAVIPFATSPSIPTRIFIPATASIMLWWVNWRVGVTAKSLLTQMTAQSVVAVTHILCSTLEPAHVFPLNFLHNTTTILPMTCVLSARWAAFVILSGVASAIPMRYATSSSSMDSTTNVHAFRQQDFRIIAAMPAQQTTTTLMANVLPVGSVIHVTGRDSVWHATKAWPWPTESACVSTPTSATSMEYVAVKSGSTITWTNVKHVRSTVWIAILLRTQLPSQHASRVRRQSIETTIQKQVALAWKGTLSRL